MTTRSILLTSVMLIASQSFLTGQVGDTSIDLSAIVYDDQFYPVPASHVINMNTHQGDVTDSLGIFRLPVSIGDTLLIRNIAFHDTLIPVSILILQRHVVIRRRYYALEEARIFEWGSTYDDFRNAIIDMPNRQTLGESMGLPKQDPDYIPYDMNEEVIKSPAFLLTSPISYFYQNFSKQAKSARKVYWLKKNQEKHKLFDQITGPENIAAITGLADEELLRFLGFLYQRLVCDFNCSEIKIYEEVHKLWEIYQNINGI